MNIYVTASSDSTVGNRSAQRIVTQLEHLGHTVYQHILSAHLPDVHNVTRREIRQWYDQWSRYIISADFAVVEGSYPSSIHVGFEIGAIALRSKPIILLYQEGLDPVFIHELYYSRLIKSGYTNEKLGETVDWCLREL